LKHLTLNVIFNKMENKVLLKKSILFFCLIAFIQAPVILRAQNAKKQYAEASALFNNNLYSQALTILLSIDTAEPDNNNLNYKIGVCYFNAPVHQEKAIPYLIKACSDISAKYSQTNLKEKHAPADARLYLAKAYHLNCQFDSAISNLNKFVALIDTVGDKQTEKDINKELRECIVGKDLVTYPVKMTVTDLGDSINSPFPDYSPVVSADESQLFFTSRRIGDKDPTTGQFYENIYIANFVNGHWAQAQNIGAPINEKDKHDATVGLSPDGQTILIYRDDGNGDGNIYTTHLRGTTWSSPKKLDENVDSKFWEPSASISADGQVLYFSSNRPGGFGGLDIYMSRLLPNGEWGKAVNMGPKINTSEDDDAPYIHPDNKTLYFSSKGHATMGGYDIFVSTLDSNNQWGAPVNIGYPVNTPGDDIFFVPTTDGRGAYYSSFRDSGVGEKDIYRINFPEKKAEPITVYRGLIVSATDTNLPDNIEIVVTDNATGDQVGIYHPNISTGKYLIILPCGKNYDLTYNVSDTMFHKENVDVRDSTAYNVIDRAVDLKPLVIGQKIAMKHRLTAPTKNGSTSGSEASPELQKLADLLKANKNLKIEVAGHMHGKGSEKDNLSESQASADAMVKYLVSIGIDSNRLKAKGYGSAEPMAKNGKGAQTENGIEFTVLSNDTIGNAEAARMAKLKADKIAAAKIAAANNKRSDKSKEVGNSNLIAGNGKSAAIRNILIQGGQSELSPEAKAELQKLHDFMVANPNVNVEISGYADGTGSEKANLSTSQSSAQSIINYLVSLGIDSNRLKAKGYGSSLATAKNKTKLTAEDGTLIEYKVLNTTSKNTLANNNSKGTQVQLGSSKLAAGNGKSAAIKNILVPSGQSELSAEAKAELQKLHDFMVANPNVNVEISGYANGMGSEQENLSASRASAQSIINYLVSLGIDSNRLKAKGYGSSIASKSKLTSGTGSLVEFKVLPNSNSNSVANSGKAKHGKNNAEANSINYVTDKSAYDKAGVSKDDNIHFAIGKAEIVPKYYDKLEKLYSKMIQSKDMTIEIMGHTDSLGNDYINSPLSLERAKAVITYLVNKGIDKSRFTAKGFGANIPIEKNKNADGSWNWDGMRLNRRAEIKILTGGTSANEGAAPANK